MNPLVSGDQSFKAAFWAFVVYLAQGTLPAADASRYASAA